MATKKISISIPEELLKKLDNLCARLGVSRSEFITKVLEERLGMIDQEGREYPSVLWKLSTYGVLRTRSPRYRGRRIKGRWIVEEVNED